MKKYLISALVSVIAILGVMGFAKADDGGPNTAFWLKDNKIICISIVDPDSLLKSTDSNIKNKVFFVFDYTPKVGAALGKPWAIMEEGKCYQLGDDYGLDYGYSDNINQDIIYEVDVVDGDERQKIENLRVDSAARFDDHYQDWDNSWINSYTRSKAHDMFLRLRPESESFVTTPESIHFMSITTNNLFPTKYDFSLYTTWIYSSPGEWSKILSDESWITASSKYIDLAQNLEKTIQSCDNRLRVEYQFKIVKSFDGGQSYSLGLERQNVIWRLNNKKDLFFDAEQSIFSSLIVNPLKVIETIGCKAAFSSYIKSHQNDFNEVDKLAEELIKKYPNAAPNELMESSKKTMTDSDSIQVEPSSLTYESYPILRRSNTEIEKIMTFVNSDSTTSSENLATSTVVSTNTEEPTPEKKLNILLNSLNPLMQIYILLPIVASLGIVVFFIFRKRKK